MITASLTGDKALQRKLKDLADKDIKSAVRKGSRAGCKTIQSKAKDLAPRGKTGALRRGIKVKAMARSRKRVGTTVKATGVPYYGPVEFGTKYIEAREFMKQATEQEQNKAGEEAAKIIRDEIMQAASKGGR